MRKLKYNTKYLKAFLHNLTKLKVVTTQEDDCVIIVAEDAAVLNDVVQLGERIHLPLVYQKTNGKLEVTYFDPNL